MRTDRYRRRRRRGRLPVVLLLAALILLGGWQWFLWQCWGVETTDAQAVLTGLPEGFDGFRIAHLSDLHGHEYGEDSETLLAMVAEARPELIVLTGDLIDRESQMVMVSPLAKGLADIAPTFYVTGNHEWGLGTSAVKTLKGLLADCGVTVLSNEYTVLERGGDAVILAGVDDPNGYAGQKTPEELYGEIEKQQGEGFTLLLAHRNDSFDRYAAAGYDLVLSGHGHGGIVRLPFTDGLLGVDRRLFPTWTSGLYTEGESTLFVSRGLGNNTTPFNGFRLFNRPELVILELNAN